MDTSEVTLWFAVFLFGLLYILAYAEADAVEIEHRPSFVLRRKDWLKNAPLYYIPNSIFFYPPKPSNTIQQIPNQYRPYTPTLAIKPEMVPQRPSRSNVLQLTPKQELVRELRKIKLQLSLKHIQ